METKVLEVGATVGRLTVVDSVDGEQGGKWRCLCSCGASVVVFGSNLRQGRSKSCGCLRRETSKAIGLKITHGASAGGVKSPEYVSWRDMKSRCYYEKDKSYPRYGGRGITVCKRWLNSFEAFLKDVGRKPSPQHTLDRLNNDKNYTPGNVRWSLPSRQQNNRRNNVRISYKGKTQTAMQWSRELGIPKSTILARVHKGLKANEVLSCRNLRSM